MDDDAQGNFLSNFSGQFFSQRCLGTFPLRMGNRCISNT